jgi:S-adenosylmethionine/arginine decarboxylase-like enzyme
MRFMHMESAGAEAELDRYIGYWKPYATSHDELDRDEALQDEVRNAARIVGEALRNQRAGRFRQAGQSLKDPRPK